MSGEHVRQAAYTHGFDHGKDVATGDSKAVAHVRRPQRLDDELGVVHGVRSLSALVVRSVVPNLVSITIRCPIPVPGLSRTHAGPMPTARSRADYNRVS